MSRVGVLSMLHNAVGNLATYIWLRQSFVAISFERCRYFFAHVACRNLPWQGLNKGLYLGKALQVTFRNKKSKALKPAIKTLLITLTVPTTGKLNVGGNPVMD